MLEVSGRTGSADVCKCVGCVGSVTPLTHVKLSETMFGEVLDFLCTGSDATVPVVSDIVLD